MRKIIIIIVLLFIQTLYSQSQTNNYIPFNEKIKTPSVSEYERYEFSNVNKSTGTVDISVPIYEINQDGVTIPINLTYSTTGLKVSEEASWVGLGWDLNFASIYQQINDVDDLKRFTTPNTYKGYLLPHPGNISPLTTDLKFPSLCFSGLQYGSTWITLGNLPDEHIHCFTATRYIIPLNGQLYSVFGSTSEYSFPFIPDIFSSSYTNNVDTEPDIFSINLFGNILKFIFNIQTGVIEQLNNKQYKIIYDNINNTFTVINPNGDKFYFLLNVNHLYHTYAESFDSVLNPPPSTSYTNQWYLTKVLTNKNSEINFTYTQNQNNNSPTNSNISAVKRGEIETNFILSNRCTACDYSESIDVIVSNSANNIHVPISGIKKVSTNISEKKCFLNKIIFNKGEVEFNLSNRNDVYSPNQIDYKKIDNITVKDINNNVINSFDFNYSNFISQNIGNNWKNPENEDLLRLKLESIYLNSNMYREFIYNATLLPSKTSYATDYWGYYNGQTSNVSYVPNPTRFISAGIPLNSGFTGNGNNHSANLTFAKACSLEEIILSTGGREKYIYSLNEYISTPQKQNKVPNFSNNDNVVRGVGLRIDGIELKDENNNLFLKKSYIYENGNLPNKLNFFKNYTSKYRYYTVFYGSGGSVSETNISRYLYESFESRQNNFYNSPIFFSNDLVYYEKVTEVNNNIIDSSKDYSQRDFFSTNDYLYYPGTNFSDFFDYYGPGLLDRSKLLNGTLIEKEIFDNENNLIKKISYNYIKNKSSLFYGVNTRYVASWNGFADNERPNYELHTAPRHGITFYPIYFDSNLLSQETVTEYFPSGNKITKTYYTYNSNNVLNSKSIKDTSDNSLYYESSTMLSTPSAINKNILNLPSVISIYENNRPKNKFIYSYQEINNSTLLSNVEEQSNMNSSTSSKTIYDLYDDKNNLIQFHKEGDIYTSIVWGYNKTLIVAKIENAQYSQIQTSLIQAVQNASDTGTENDLLIALDNLRNSLPNAMMTTYTHKPLIGVSSITDTKNDKITYHYDANNRLEHIKDKEGNILNEYEYHYKTQN